MNVCCRRYLCRCCFSGYYYYTVNTIVCSIIKISVGKEWRKCRREEVTCYPETRDHRRDMRVSGCHGDHRSSCRRKIPLGQRQRNCHGILTTAQYYTLCLKKRPTFKLSLTLSNLNRFSKFLHCWKAYEICYKSHMTIATLP